MAAAAAKAKGVELLAFMRSHDEVVESVVAEVLRAVEPVDVESAASLISALNHVTVNGDKTEALFGSPGARSGYIQKRFASRSSSIAALLFHAGGWQFPLCWGESCRAYALRYAAELADILALLFPIAPLGESERAREAEQEDGGLAPAPRAALGATDADDATSRIIRLATIGGAAGEYHWRGLPRRAHPQRVPPAFLLCALIRAGAPTHASTTHTHERMCPGEAAFAAMAVRDYVCSASGASAATAPWATPVSVHSLVLDFEEVCLVLSLSAVMDTARETKGESRRLIFTCGTAC
jgi:hypothetical protein